MAIRPWKGGNGWCPAALRRGPVGSRAKRYGERGPRPLFRTVAGPTIAHGTFPPPIPLILCGEGLSARPFRERGAPSREWFACERQSRNFMGLGSRVFEGFLETISLTQGNQTTYTVAAVPACRSRRSVAKRRCMRKIYVVAVEVGMALMLNVTAGLLQRSVAILFAKLGWLVLILTMIYFVLSDNRARTILDRMRANSKDWIWKVIVICSSVATILAAWTAVSHGCDRLFAELPNAPSPRPAPAVADPKDIAKETASEVSKLLRAPTITFDRQTKIWFRHGLHTKVPRVTCTRDDGVDLKTWDGPRVIDQDTVEYIWSKPTTGTCSATGGLPDNVVPVASDRVQPRQPTVNMQLALVTTIYKMRDEKGAYMNGGQNDLIGVLRVEQKNGVSIRHVRSLSVTGVAPISCNEYVGALGKNGDSIAGLAEQCGDRRPWVRVSSTTFPAENRIDPSDEQFVKLAITSNMGGAPRPAGDPKFVYGLENPRSEPKYVFTSPAWYWLVRFTKARPDLTIVDPGIQTRQ